MTNDVRVANPMRWRALIVLCLVQFMLVVDMTVVNVALPRIQHDLGFSGPGLAWVVNGYVVMAGGLLLLGGRLADVYGRRRMFLTGVAIFAVASAACGAAIAPAMLVASRFVQGMGEAMAAPASLGLIAVLFTSPQERAKALGAWGGIIGLAAVTGVVISGALTDLASWRWIFYINLPLAALALATVPRMVSESRMVREQQRLDFGGAITSTGGLVGMVFGLLQAVSHSWGSGQVILPLLGGIGLVAIAVVVEGRSSAPLIPLRFFRNRTRVVANIAGLLFAAGIFEYFFLMTLFEQQVLGFSPLQGGLGYLPFGFAFGVGVGIGSALLPRIGVKPVLTIGLFGAAVGLLLASGIHFSASYVDGLLPGMIVLGVFCGLAGPAAANAGLHAVNGQDASLASGVQQALQQLGGALGLACLVTLALRFAADQIHNGVLPAVAATNGYALSFRIAALTFVIAGVLVLVLLEQVSVQRANQIAETSEEVAA